MCRRGDKEQGKQECQKPKNLKGAPQNCTPAQIKKCHGGVADHPCVHSKKPQ